MRGLLLLGVFLLLFLLPAYPPLLKAGVEGVLPLLGLEGKVGAVGGHPLWGLTLRGVFLKGPGWSLEAEEVGLGYYLPALLWGEVPLRLRLARATLRPTWEALFPEAPGPPPRFRLRFTRLELEEVALALPEGKRLFLPPLQATLGGANPYRIQARLPGGRLGARAEVLSGDLARGRVEFWGDLGAFRHFYPGLARGKVRGRLAWGPRPMGEARVEEGEGELLGFALRGVFGTLRLEGNRVEARLKGIGLEGPLAARATVDLGASRYAFALEGWPRLPALARHYRLNLPVEGEGRLELWGEGWERVRVAGRFQGVGRLLGEAFRYQGSLGYEGAFWLRVQALGHYLDRDYQAQLALRGGVYEAAFRDGKGSRIHLEGQGSRLRAWGLLAWPFPLEGLARVAFRMEGGRWALGVESPGVALPLAPPLDLSGEAFGEGERVWGRLGPLAFGGRWEDLAFTLDPLPLRVGHLQGQGRLLRGRLQAHLRYLSPYLSLPLALRQGEGGFWWSTPYGRGSYRDGVLEGEVRGLPLVGEVLRASGRFRYAGGEVSGRLLFQGRHLEGEARLKGLGAELGGWLRTPWGSWPLEGAYGPKGLALWVGTLRLLWGEEGLALRGRMDLGPWLSSPPPGPLLLEADLAYRGGFTGWARLVSPWGEGVLEGRGEGLFLRTSGYVEASGEVYPALRLEGRLNPPEVEGLELPPLPLSVEGLRVHLPGVGQADLGSGRFALGLPFRYRGVEGFFRAEGGLGAGRLRLETPYGVLEGQGPWRALALGGRLALPLGGLGEGRLVGQADLLGLAYWGRVFWPERGARLLFRGEGPRLHLQAQAPGLWAEGEVGPRGFQGRLALRGFSLAPFGLPWEAWGAWGERGGRVLLQGPEGRVEVWGGELLKAQVRLEGPYLEGEGRVDPEGLHLALRGGYEGGVGIWGRAEGGGPWGDLRFALEGRARVPYLEPLAFRGEARYQEGRLQYRLEGPIALEGEGLRYRGTFRLPFALWGVGGLVQGTFWGEGLAVEGEGQGLLGDLPFTFLGHYRETPFLEVRYEGGWARLTGTLAFGLEVGPLARQWGWPLEGRAQGSLDLSGEGEAQAELRYGGEPLALVYREGVLSLRLPAREAGLAWDREGGRLQGLGALLGEGVLRLGGEGYLAGAFRYRGLSLSLKGPLSRLEVSAVHEALPGTVLGAELDLLGLKGEGRLSHASPYGEGHLDLLWAQGRYVGQGWLEALGQAGPLRLEGEGLGVEASWEAPLALRASYREGDWSLALKGEGEVQGVWLRADLAYGPGGYRGFLEGRHGAWAFRGRGEGPLALAFAYPLEGGDLRGEARLEGLGLKGHLSAGVWSTLDLEADFLGDLGSLQGEGQGVLRLRGEGEERAYPFRLALDLREGRGVEALALSLRGPGLALDLLRGRLRLEADLDLTPLGLPFRLKAQGDGPWEAPIGVALLQPWGLAGGLEGTLDLHPLGLRLRGEVAGEALALAYGEGGVELAFFGPHLGGRLRYQGGLEGRVLAQYPLGEGILQAEADLGRGHLRLLGQGALRGGGEGRFCLPSPLGPCEALEAHLGLDLAYGPFAFRGGYRYREGALLGEGLLATPYGGVRAVGRGLGLDLLGVDLPLEGHLALSPLALDYRYQGPLPLLGGEASLAGGYPGDPWLRGTFRHGELALALEGKPGFLLALRGEGLEGEVGPKGVDLAFRGFRYGPLVLKGRVQGPWAGAGASLEASAFGRVVRAQGVLGLGGLDLALGGDLEGRVVYRGGWSGEVRFPQGRLGLEGEGAWPQARGEVWGQEVVFRFPHLGLGGLVLDLGKREARGEEALRLGSLEALLKGKGQTLSLRLPLEGLLGPRVFPGPELRADLDLEGLTLTLTPSLGQGALRYREGRVEGAWAWEEGGFRLALQGAGRGVRVRLEHPPSPWWAPGAGTLEGEVGLDGGYRLDYRAGPQALALSGRLLEARLRAQGPYLQGELTYPEGGSLRVDLPLSPLESRLRARVGGAGYGVEGTLEGGVGLLVLSGRLLPLGGEVRLEKTPLERIPYLVPFLTRYTPHLRGVLSGRLALLPGPWGSSPGQPLSLDLEGNLEVAGTPIPLRFRGAFGGGEGQGEGFLGATPFRVGLLGDRLDLRLSPRDFPLHLLLAAAAGPLEGEAFWTGEARLRLPLADPWAGEGVLVGESLLFRGGGDALRGRAVFRLEGGRFYVDLLRLVGRGTWEGRGYWSPRGSNLYLSLRDTVYTPVLQVIPALKPYHPEASGTLILRLTERGFRLEAEALRFRLGPFAGEVPRALLSLDGGTQAEGEIQLVKPYPGRFRLGLEGRLEDFRVTARGEASLPGLPGATPMEIGLLYPGYRLEARLLQPPLPGLRPLELSGTLLPLRLAGYGALPVAYPRYYLQEGVLDVKGFLLYVDKEVYHLTGNAEVVRARLAIPEGEAQALAQEGLEVAKAEPLPLVFDRVRIYAQKGVLVQESLAQGEFKGEVYLEGTHADPYLIGEVRPLWGGFRLWDTFFNLDPSASRLLFLPHRGILPEMALKASAEAGGYRVELTVEGAFLRENGRVKARLTPAFTSEPPLGELEVYALLAFGTPDLTRLGETFPQVALGAALENLLVGQLEKELARGLGLDRIQVQLPLLQGGKVEDTAFSIGKYLSPQVFLGYKVDLRGAQSLYAQYRADSFTFTLDTAFSPLSDLAPRLSLGLAYALTPDLGLTLHLEGLEGTRFGVGAAYRW